MSKPPEENKSDMEVGMTTAERRRRSRRGGGLRVPSDNVPRRGSTPAVATTDDPTVAIAYTASNGELLAAVQDPIAPEAVSTLIDPPGEPLEEVSFETKTREMSAIDLEALGIEDPSRRGETSTDPGKVVASPSTVVVDEELYNEAVEITNSQLVVVTEPEPPPPPPPAAEQPAGRSPLSPAMPARASTPSIPPVPVIAPPPAAPPPATPEAPSAFGTAPGSPPPPATPPAAVAAALPHVPSGAIASPSPDAPERAAVVDLSVAQAPTAPLVRPDPASHSTADSLPPPRVKGRAPTLALSEEDLEEFLEENRDRLERRGEDTGEIDVDVDVDASGVPVPVDSGWQSARVAAPVAERAAAAPPPEASQPVAPRSLTPLGVPVVVAGAAAAEPSRLKPVSSPPPPPQGNSPPAGVAPRAAPPPAPAKPPPAPPKKAEKRPEVASPEAERKARSKSWFAEVFDEDYLRTLPFLTPQATQAEAEFVAASLGTSPGAKLLDVGCGYGRHAMELAARGYHVVGLDLSTPLLVRGGEEAHRRGLTINFIRGDMRELEFDGQFDGAYCLFSTFGYFDDETNKKTAGNLSRALRPGGKCVFEILNRDYIIADLPTRVWWEGDGCVVLEEVDFNYFSSRVCVNRSVVFDDTRQLEQEISIRAYSLHEVGKLMLAAGFRVLEVSGSYQTRGRFFGNQSRHIIVVAERI
ncbi:MAG: class I SAM-dependent methyltransferase [Kofleriaceae bacterium]